MARLDYIFAPQSNLGVTTAKPPLSCPFSDHRLVTLDIYPQNPLRGKGFWRMQTFIIEREDFRLKLKRFLVQRIEDTIDLPHDTRWEYIKLGIREFSIQYYNQLKDEQSCLEKDLVKRLSDLEVQMVDSPSAAEKYHLIKRELFQLQLLEARQAMLRSRSTWLSQGECPTSYFLNLEKRNDIEKTISSIFNDQGSLITNRKDILDFEKNYFSSLHSGEGDIHPNLPLQDDPFCSLQLTDTLDDLDRTILNDDITLEELEEAL